MQIQHSRFLQRGITPADNIVNGLLVDVTEDVIVCGFHPSGQFHQNVIFSNSTVLGVKTLRDCVDQFWLSCCGVCRIISKHAASVSLSV
ncbi:hypothetical protein ENTCAN_06154 [Enterobacter cancerogenus ATCC 35316]|nr:hypothetical protein ENTCAN_06154 [Enterobacter cancerogenus ATCC 35316]